MADQSTVGTLKGKLGEIAHMEPKEGALTQAVEKQTAKVPSIGYLALAVGSMAVSAGLAIFSNKKEYANFVGLWAPSFLLIGIYNKLVKIEGSDRFEKEELQSRKAA
jgi:hypothetical protein